MKQQCIARTTLGLVMAALLVVTLIPFASPSSQLAFADETAPKTAYQLQQEIEEAQQAYTEAREVAEEAAKNVEEHEKRIEDIENNQIPAQQKRAGDAMREMYKVQQNAIDLVDVLLNAGSLQDFVNQYEYISRIADKNRSEMNRLLTLKAQLEESRTELRKAQEEADQRVDEAEEALDAAKAAQAEAQARIEEEARMQASIAANAAAMAEQDRVNDEVVIDNPPSGPSDSGTGSGSDDSGSGSGSGDSGYSGPPESYDSLDGWAARIDAYLAGSPMAGQGYTFASAALAYGVDPRFSPAIACAESGKGYYCFLPYNAWGWGSCSWDSWEEAIYDHVAGLSRGYGYTVTVEGAKKYCPPNWQHWYNMVSSQMALI